MDESALLTFDFAETFPHKMWISNWGMDDKYPDGFRYKILSISEPGDLIWFVVILQQRDGRKEVLTSLETNRASFDRTVAVFVDGLAEEYGIGFELQDFSACRTAHEFERLSLQYGWTPSDL